jgi:(R,R)-butanediol dehydrogenase/meso-butanediol dehydrogenase/diacetyl reductase
MICGSDLHMLDMPAEMIPAGLVLGHEFTAVVADLGPGVDGWDAGERVTVLPMVSCGECCACRTGHRNLCEPGSRSSWPSTVAGCRSKRSTGR